MTTPKPDNTPEFFSARKPDSKVVSLKFTKFAKPVSHGWRYFVAGGESLDKIHEVERDAANLGKSMQALADSVGAEKAEHGHFYFPKGSAVEEVKPALRLYYQPVEGFYSTLAAPGDFLPVVDNWAGHQVKLRMNAVEALPAAEQDAARAALAKEFKAESFDGKVFKFKDWEQNVKNEVSKGTEYRLVANPMFVREEYDEGAYSIDREAPGGFALAERVSEVSRHIYPEARFGDWLRQFEQQVHLNSREGKREELEVEKIGNEWIIKVPVDTAGIFGADGKGGMRNGDKEGWVLPPGATPIKVSEYYARLEDSGSLRALPNAGPKPN